MDARTEIKLLRKCIAIDGKIDFVFLTIIQSAIPKTAIGKILNMYKCRVPNNSPVAIIAPLLIFPFLLKELNIKPLNSISSQIAGIIATTNILISKFLLNINLLKFLADSSEFGIIFIIINERSITITKDTAHIARATSKSLALNLFSLNTFFISTLIYHAYKIAIPTIIN